MGNEATQEDNTRREIFEKIREGLLVLVLVGFLALAAILAIIVGGTAGALIAILASCFVGVGGGLMLLRRWGIFG